jgi:hypothetical protein
LMKETILDTRARLSVADKATKKDDVRKQFPELRSGPCSFL